jgi:hypothetical protein
VALEPVAPPIHLHLQRERVRWRGESTPSVDRASGLRIEMGPKETRPLRRALALEPVATRGPVEEAPEAPTHLQKERARWRGEPTPSVGPATGLRMEAMGPKETGLRELAVPQLPEIAVCRRESSLTLSPRRPERRCPRDIREYERR